MILWRAQSSQDHGAGPSSCSAKRRSEKPVLLGPGACANRHTSLDRMRESNLASWTKRISTGVKSLQVKKRQVQRVCVTCLDRLLAARDNTTWPGI